MRYGVVPAKNTDHLFLLNGENRAGANRSRRVYAKRNTSEARLTKEITDTQDSDNCWPTTFRPDGERHVAFSDVEERVGRFTLGVDYLFVSIPRDRSTQHAFQGPFVHSTTVR